MSRGGCAVVWLAEDEETKQRVAIKQSVKAGASKTELENYKAEIIANSILFSSTTTEGIDDVGNIARYISFFNSPRDIWLIHEVGGQSLTRHLFDIQGKRSDDN